MRRNYREQVPFEEESFDSEFITTPSEKAERDTVVIEQPDGAILKRRWQTVQGRRYLVCAQFSTPGNGQTVRQKLEHVIDLVCESENISA